MYYLHDGPKRGFVRKKLLVVPADTELPPPSFLIESPTALAPKAPLPRCGITISSVRMPSSRTLAFAVVRAQPQRFMLVGAHHPSVYSHFSVGGGIYAPR